MSRRRTPIRAQDESPDETAEARRKREQYLRETAERDRALQASRRALFTTFRIWTICPDSRCRRHRACSGDVDVCMYERWHRVIPPDVKALLGKIADNLRSGMTRKEALAAAGADMERNEAARKRLAAQLAAPQPRVQSEPPAPPPARRAQRAPRIRSV